MAHKYFGEILKGTRAVITGANRGLGLLMARRFLECGASVAICSAPNENYEDAVEKLQKLNANYHVKGFSPNLSSKRDIDVMTKEIVSDWGGIDILINNAGIYPSSNFAAYAQELFQTVFDVNVTGMFVTSQVISEIMAEQGGGVIVNTSSVAGVDGAMGNIGYTASKFAVEGLTLGMARELGPKKIRVNAVAPAGIKSVDFDGNEKNPSERNLDLPEEKLLVLEKAEAAALQFAPMGRYQGHPDEIINAFIFLASDAASFISGETLVVSGACIWPAASPMSLSM